MSQVQGSIQFKGKRRVWRVQVFLIDEMQVGLVQGFWRKVGILFILEDFGFGCNDRSLLLCVGVVWEIEVRFCRRLIFQVVKNLRLWDFLFFVEKCYRLWIEFYQG